jgi:hypothetical protein
MRRIIGAVVVITGIVAALFTIASGVVYFCPACNPFHSAPPNIAGEWDGSLAIKTGDGPSGEIHLSLAEKADGALTGRLTVSPPLSTNNEGTLTVGNVANDGHVDFTVQGDSGLINLTFSGIYDTGNHRLSGIYYTQNGFSGAWDATKSKSAALDPVIPPSLVSGGSLQYVAEQALRGGTSLLCIVLGLILLNDHHTRATQTKQ